MQRAVVRQTRVVLRRDVTTCMVVHAGLMVTGLSQRCWRAWWEKLTPTERTWWHTHAQRPFLTPEQAQLLRTEGLPLVAIPGQDQHGEQVLLPVDLADLLEHDADPH